MDQRHQDLPENLTHFDPNQHIILERSHYERLQAHIEHLGQKLKRLKQHPQETKKKRGFWGWFLRRPTAVVVVVVVIFIIGSAARSDFTGNDWMNLDRESKLIYMDGYMSGITFWKIQSEKPNAKAIWNCIKSWPAGQALDVVEQYIKNNPQVRDYKTFLLIHDAFLDACAKRYGAPPSK